MPSHRGIRKNTGTGEANSTKGSRHPDSIGSGREMPDEVQSPSVERLNAEGTNSTTPSGVRENSGTEDRKSDPKTKTSLPTSARPSGSDGRKPSGVRSHDGFSTPESVK